jgi:hypothetical protein
MKTASAILALFLAQSASAFTPSGVKTTSGLSAATSTAEVVSEVSNSIKEDSIKYETDVTVEQKFKVVDIDPATLDPKKRVQV